MRRRSPFLCALVLTLLASSPRAGADEPTPRSAPPSAPANGYDEDGLVRFALAHNPDLRAQQWDGEIASAGVTTASALSNPEARVEWLHAQSPSNYGWGAGLEWAPPQPGVYGSKKAAARAHARAVGEDLAESAADLESRVRAGFAQVDALTEEVELASRSVATRRSIHDAVKQRLDHGAASRIDLSLVDVSLARGEQERDALVMARTSATAQLAALSGLAPESPLPLQRAKGVAGAGPEATATASADKGLVDRALTSRAVIRADAARSEEASETIDRERAKRWPWIELVARYRFHDQSTYPNDVTLGLDITLPILDRNTGHIDAATAAQNQQRDNATAHRLAIARDVHVLRAESARRAELADHYAQAITPVLQEHAALVKQSLEGLELDLTALLAAEDMVTRGGIEYVEARLAQRRAQIALARALGDYGRRAPGGK